MLNCMFWIFYGLPVVHPDSTLVISINSAGLLLEFIYLNIFLFYTTKKNRVHGQNWLNLNIVRLTVLPKLKHDFLYHIVEELNMVHNQVVFSSIVLRPNNVCFELHQIIIALSLLGEIALLAIVAVFTLLCFHSHASRSMFVGIICVICGIIMYGSPLTIIVSAISSCYDP